MKKCLSEELINEFRVNGYIVLASASGPFYTIEDLSSSKNPIGKLFADHVEFNNYEPDNSLKMLIGKALSEQKEC